MEAQWLLRSTPDRAVWVQALAEDIGLRSCPRHFTLTVPLSTKGYKWLPDNFCDGKGGRNAVMDYCSILSKELGRVGRVGRVG